mmetsp:Transcript_19367/g.3155  ORF Transcript_19367/g.3155 Transcript_19367/m.3155 type:complete len:91 (+) Transcript_19367:92-364(+)
MYSLSVILFPIWPNEHSFSMLFIVLVLSCIFSAIWPLKMSLTMHFVLNPVPSVYSSISSFISSQSLYIVVKKASFKARAIGPDEFSLSSL